ncbi:hypothetical protein [Mycolicibacterium iranicum]|uniref:hypothetical protein n=1 Tax=Mycolicibacterium iranicum TaxID=912594 RepID=UPI0013F4C7CC|nr:hypothetical protein [Mycolicibacterium iranicum]
MSILTSTDSTAIPYPGLGFRAVHRVRSRLATVVRRVGRGRPAPVDHPRLSDLGP